MRRFWRKPPEPTHGGPETSAPERMPVDLVGTLRAEFPEHFELVWKATQDVIDAIDGTDLRPLARNSPGLEDYDWPAYLRASAARLVRVVHLLDARGVRDGRALDIGGYFGNMSLVLQRYGLEAHSSDAYESYEGCLDPALALLRSEGGNVIDTGLAGAGIAELRDASFDVVTCLGVIEHVPHTPKGLLLELRRLLRPGGHVVLDTPNIAYIHRRWQLNRGESVHTPISTQFHSQVPFEGHHREYTGSELLWMLDEVGFTEAELVTFDYSRLALTELAGETLQAFRIAEADPTARELLMAVACRPAS